MYDPLIVVLGEVMQDIFDKQFYGIQFSQYEFDLLVDTANRTNQDKEWQPLINRAQDLLDIEKNLDYMHCENIKIHS